MTAIQVMSEKPAQPIDPDEHTSEKPADVILDAAVKGQAVSGYETLTHWQTVKSFKIATAVCFAAAFSAATDGYQIA